MRKKIFLMSISILFLSLFLLSQNIKIGEVSYYEGSAKICREIEGATKCEFLRFGMSIFKEDTVITTDGRVEIDFGNNDFLRMDKDSEVFFSLTDKCPNIEVKRGAVYLSTVSKEKYRILSRGNTAEISTPGKYRIESNDKTLISVINGFAEVTFFNGSFTSLSKGEMVEAKNGKIVKGFSATYDFFDRFVQKRERIYAVPSKEKEVAYYPPYWYYEPYWMWSSYYYWLPYSYWYYPFYGYWPYHWYYIPYREVPYFRSENWKNVLTKESQVFKGGNPPSSSPVRYRYSSPYSGSRSSSHYGSGSSSSYGSISKSTISSSSSSHSSSSGSSGHAKPKDN